MPGLARPEALLSSATGLAQLPSGAGKRIGAALYAAMGYGGRPRASCANVSRVGGLSGAWAWRCPIRCRQQLRHQDWLAAYGHTAAWGLV